MSAPFISKQNFEKASKETSQEEEKEFDNDDWPLNGRGRIRQRKSGRKNKEKTPPPYRGNVEKWIIKLSNYP